MFFSVCVSKLIKKRGFEGIANLVMGQVAILDSPTAILGQVLSHRSYHEGQYLLPQRNR